MDGWVRVRVRVSLFLSPARFASSYLWRSSCGTPGHRGAPKQTPTVGGGAHILPPGLGSVRQVLSAPRGAPLSLSFFFFSPGINNLR